MRRRRHPQPIGVWLSLAIALVIVVGGLLVAAYVAGL
jgi:hypothetical protein